LLEALDSGVKRACTTWHRRAGKDVTLWNYMIRRAFEEVGIYFYLLPEYTQARKILWDGINNDGFKFLDYIHPDILEHSNATEMKLTLKNGSIVQLVGTDRFDTIRGTNPRGCVFSEYAFQNPMAWEVVTPILRVNKGWAVFNSTPNGKNHFYDMYTMAKDNPNWFCELLTVEDTGVVSEEEIQQERLEGKEEEMIQQEYYCSFDIGALGAYYAKQVNEARDQDRICNVAWEKLREVDVILDLGKTDDTAIGFRQQVGQEIRFIDYYEAHGKEVAHYVRMLRAKPYDYGTMYLPHDATHKRLESPKTIEQQFKEAGFRTKIVQKTTIGNGIQEVRRLFPRFWFDQEKCKQWVRALENYHREYDREKKVFKQQPMHDWSSHCADMTRYAALSVKKEYHEEEIVTDFDKFAVI